MNQVRYRTETFSGLQERDAAEVMAFETFELGNTDILEHVSQNLLKDPKLIEMCASFVRELEDNGFVGDMGPDKVNFFREVLADIAKETGISVKYALWLADLPTVFDFYGKDMFDENDYDSYEVGPVVLTDLGYDGTLYGYTKMPVCLEERIERLQNQLTDIINMRESKVLYHDNTKFLDQRYREVEAAIREIDEILYPKGRPAARPPLSEQIRSASDRASGISISETEMSAIADRAQAKLNAQARESMQALDDKISFAESRATDHPLNVPSKIENPDLER